MENIHSTEAVKTSQRELGQMARVLQELLLLSARWVARHLRQQELVSGPEKAQPTISELARPLAAEPVGASTAKNAHES